MTLETKDTHQLTITELNDDGRLKLHLQGLAFHSSLAVTEVRTDTDKDVINVNVLLCPARPELSGRFSVNIHVPPSVQRVTMGNDQVTLWSRDDGSCFQASKDAPEANLKLNPLVDGIRKSTAAPLGK